MGRAFLTEFCAKVEQVSEKENAREEFKESAREEFKESAPQLNSGANLHGMRR